MQLHAASSSLAEAAGAGLEERAGAAAGGAGLLEGAAEGAAERAAEGAAVGAALATAFHAFTSLLARSLVGAPYFSPASSPRKPATTRPICVDASASTVTCEGEAAW